MAHLTGWTTVAKCRGLGLLSSLPDCRLELCCLELLPPTPDCRQHVLLPVCCLDSVPPCYRLDSVPPGRFRRSLVEAMADSRCCHCFGL
ncbi:hypothetical protein GUJ93_ZPchr0013g35044 [Zizania palustris]|uniref:Uncharacterized protein n=1 Tax=Zizania palustris TaxID=103762 RepID=A0A8J6C2W3_ZIZPA|nr:hypothetical protein GUJ93_ZPchr0013g35044 [Zizania palustris]